MRNARSRARATSRCEIKRTLPRLVNRSRTGVRRSSPRHGPTSQEPDRDRAARSKVLAGALTSARGRDRRRHDVLEGVVGAHPAVVAGRPPAIGEPVLGEGGLPVVPQEVVVQPGGDVVPRQHLVAGAVPGHVPVGIEALGVPSRRSSGRASKCSLHSWKVPPARHTALDDPADPAVAAAGDALGERRRAGRASAPGPGALGSACAAARPCGCSSATPFWPNHWNGVCGFGTNPPTRHGAARAAWCDAGRSSTTLRGQLGDAERVLVHLGGQPGEEVELHPPPTLRVGGVDRAVQVLLGISLLMTWRSRQRPGLGREREARCGAPSGSGSRCPTVNASTRRLRQRHADAARAAWSSTRSATTPSIPEKSALDSDVSATSS